MNKIAIIFAAGQGKRFSFLPFGIKHKSLLIVKKRTLIEHTINNLLLITNLNKIIIIVGYEKEAFQFLLKKYPQVILVTNLCFAYHRTACALLRIKKYLLKAHLAFFITGDMVCYRNYFLEISNNLNTMVAIKPNQFVNSNSLYYRVNSQNEIIAIQRQFEPGTYLLGEFSFLKYDWINAIRKMFTKHQKHLPFQDVYQVLMNARLKYNITVKMHLLDLPGPSDVDSLIDWEQVQKILT